MALIWYLKFFSLPIRSCVTQPKIFPKTTRANIVLLSSVTGNPIGRLDKYSSLTGHQVSVTSWVSQLEGAIQDILAQTPANQTDLICAIINNTKSALETARRDMELTKYVPILWSVYGVTRCWASWFLGFHTRYECCEHREFYFNLQGYSLITSQMKSMTPYINVPKSTQGL